MRILKTVLPGAAYLLWRGSGRAFLPMRHALFMVRSYGPVGGISPSDFHNMVMLLANRATVPGGESLARRARLGLGFPCRETDCRHEAPAKVPTACQGGVRSRAR